jgi:hypothetical protein
MDPLPFSGGFRLQWRNGDLVNPNTGEKCFTLAGTSRAGDPRPSLVSSYAWSYIWT